MVLWIRIGLPMRGHRFDPWLWKVPHAAEQLSPCSTAPELVLWSPRAATAEARRPRQTCTPYVTRGVTAVRSPGQQGRAAPAGRN